MTRETTPARRRIRGPAAWVLIGFTLAFGRAVAVRAQSDQVDLAGMSLEDLLNIEVTSVSKRAERLADAAASVYVLTHEDIRRSGAATVADALRLVPGLHVGQIDVNGWSVSVRGFGGRFANKLLVLVDGQSLYSPLFSGVHWAAVNVAMNEIDRIEVVRGPGATLWGANAVNGVINIITRSAASSQGAAVMAEVGGPERVGGSLRYGGRLRGRSTYRWDVGGFSRTGTSMDDGGASESWQGGRIGIRVEGEVGARSRYALIGNGVFSRADERWTVPTLLAPYRQQVSDRGTNRAVSILGRWVRTTAQAQTTFQALAEQTTLHEFPLDERRRTIDLDLQQTRELGKSHQLVVGGTYRRSSDLTQPSSLISLDPGRRTLQLWSGFAQDEMSLRDDRVRLTVGSKVEHNDYTGWEFQPNVRARLGLSTSQSMWGAVSRAVRLPNRAETDGTIEPIVMPPSLQVPLAQLLSLRHGDDVAAEVLVAYELGYRSQPSKTFSIDASVFLNQYRQLLTSTVGSPVVRTAPVPHLLVPVVFQNEGNARMAGGEVMAEWRPADELRLQAGYSRLATLKDWRDDQTVNAAPQGDYPAHQVHVRGGALLFQHTEVDAAARYVSALKAVGVPAYVEVDARLGLRLGDLDVSIIGRNLLAPDHSEYRPDVLFTARTQLRRYVGVRVHWLF